MIRNETAAQLIARLNEMDETEDLEAKSISGSTVGKSFYETVCALANEPGLGGGVLLLGVSKEEALFPIYTATGVGDPDKLSSDISSTCATKFNNPVRVSITAEKVNRKIVLKVSVPEVPLSQKPVYISATGLPKGAFRRSGPTDVRCTDEDLSTFFTAQGHEAADSAIVQEASWHDIDASAVAAYRRVRREFYPDASELNLSDEDLLVALGGAKKRDGRIKITSAGLLLFGSAAALRRLYPSLRFDYIRVNSHGWAENPANPFDALEMRGPLLLMAQRIMSTIADELPKAYQIGEDANALRQETPVIPYRVIREAVVNALMHRNYRLNKPVQILRYPNRIVIKNPGYSLKAEERFDEPGSAIRNPAIAEVLHETRLAETKGSGIKVMKQMMAQSGLAAPTFESDRTLDEFTATFLFHHFLDENDVAWLAGFKGLSLTEGQMKALIFLREVGAIDNSVYRSLNSVDTLEASKSLRALKTMDLLSIEGAGAKTSYVPGPSFLKLTTMDGSTTGKPLTMDAKGDDAGQVSEIAALMSLLPKALLTEVKTAQLAPRLKPDHALRLIEKLCKWRDLSLNEISALLSKSPNHVSSKYLQQLIQDGRVTYVIPEMIQHPHQRYKTVDHQPTSKPKQ